MNIGDTVKVIDQDITGKVVADYGFTAVIIDDNSEYSDGGERLEYRKSDLEIISNKEKNMEQSQEFYNQKRNEIKVYTVTYRAIRGDAEKFLSEDEFNALPENEFWCRVGKFKTYDEYVQENTTPVQLISQALEGTPEYFPNINEVNLRLWNFGNSQVVEEAEGHNNGLTDEQIEDLKECNHTTSIFTFYGTGTKAVAEIRAVWLNFTLHGVLNCMNDIVGNEGINFK